MLPHSSSPTAPTPDSNSLPRTSTSNDNHRYRINFVGQLPSTYDIDDLLHAAWDDDISFSVLAIAPDLREGLNFLFSPIYRRDAQTVEIEEVTHITTRWGDVDIEVDEELPAHIMQLR